MAEAKRPVSAPSLKPTQEDRVWRVFRLYSRAARNPARGITKRIAPLSGIMPPQQPIRPTLPQREPPLACPILSAAAKQRRKVVEWEARLSSQAALLKHRVRVPEQPLGFEALRNGDKRANCQAPK